MVSEIWKITLFTLGIAALSTLLILPFGVALAWLLARRKWAGKSLVETVIVLPLVIPPVATGLILLKLFGRRGWLGAFIGNQLGIEIVFTWKAVVLATAVMALPLFVRTARVAFEAIPREVEDSARIHGADGWQVFRYITLPMAARGLVAGGVLAFARALGEFGATVMVAGFIPGRTVTLALGIYQHVQLGQDDVALGMVAVSAILAFVAIWIGEYLLRNPAEPSSITSDD
jgi:molybdate transport system permease protein